MKNRIGKLVFLLVGAGLVTLSHAEFKEDIPSGKTTITVATPANNAKPVFFGSYFKNIVDVGVMPSGMSSLMGVPKSMPVLDVIKEITPSGWKVKHSGKVNLDGSASWKNGETWVEALDRIAGEFNFAVDLNWDKKIYTIKPVTVKKSEHHHHVHSVIKTNKAKKTKTTTQKVTVSVVHTDIVDKPIKKPMPVIMPQIIVPPAIKPFPMTNSGCANCSVANQTWTLLPDLSLRENMEEWSKAAGWKLVWNAVDYPVDVLTNLTGGFASDNGPIKQLSIAYKDAKRPLVFNFREGNKTLLVINYEFEQTLIKDPSFDMK